MRLRSVFEDAWKFLQVLIEKCAEDRLLGRASGLAYSSLLAVVPLIAVLFAVLTTVGALDGFNTRAKEFLYSQFLPTRHAELEAYIDVFAENAASLGAAGFIFLVITVGLLFESIEANFNDIWHARQRRRLASKISAYTSAMLLGTVFLGGSLWITARLEALLGRGVFLDRTVVDRFLALSLPASLAVIGLFLMYVIVPHARVRPRNAAWAALIAAVLWEVAKVGFARWMSGSVRYSAIYGSLAAVPIFLIWLYVNWVVVLLGLEIAFTKDHFSVLLRSADARDREGTDPTLLGTRAFALIAEHFSGGRRPPTVPEIAETLVSPLLRTHRCIDKLLAAGFVREVSHGLRAEPGYVPAKPPGEIRVAEIAEAFQPPDSAPADQLDKVVTDTLKNTVEQRAHHLGELSFGDLIESGESLVSDGLEGRNQNPAE